MLHNKETISNLETEGSTFVSRSIYFENDGPKKSWCEHCKKPWHSKETYWKLHGKLANQKPNPKRDGQAYQATTKDPHESSTNLEIVPSPRSNQSICINYFNL